MFGFGKWRARQAEKAQFSTEVEGCIKFVFGFYPPEAVIAVLNAPDGPFAKSGGNPSDSSVAVIASLINDRKFLEKYILHLSTEQKQAIKKRWHEIAMNGNFHAKTSDSIIALSDRF